MVAPLASTAAFAPLVRRDLFRKRASNASGATPDTEGVESNLLFTTHCRGATRGLPCQLVAGRGRDMGHSP